MTSDLPREELLRLPLPLAQLYGRAHSAKDARGRHDNTFYLFEALIKLAAVPAIAAYLHDKQQGAPPRPDLDRLLAQLALPSLGQWLGMLRELARHFAGGPDAAGHPLGHLWEQLSRPRRDLPAVLALYRRIKNGADGEPAGDQSCSLLAVFDALVQYRNGVFGHGGPRFDAFYEQDMGPLLFPAAGELLTGGVLDLLGPPGSRLVYLTGLRPTDAAQVEVSLRELTGAQSDRLAPLTLPPALAAGLEPQRIAVLWPGRPLPLRLDPLLVLRESDLAEEVLFLNRDRNGRQVEYLSYTTGRTERDRTTAATLAALLSRVTSRAIDEAQLEALAEQSRAATPSVEALFGPAPPQGQTLGDYELLGELGRGGMGVVYLARQLSLGRIVALKTLPADLANDETALTRFRREVRALARCDHPNIVKVLSSGTLADGRFFYTMEYVPGCTLEQVWQELAGSRQPGGISKWEGSHWSGAVLAASRKHRAPELPLPPLPEVPPLSAEPGGFVRHVAGLMRDAASALQALHEQGLIHRDVKPGNLMLTPDGQRVVLMDFGLVKGDSTTLAESRTGGLLGTLRYAAPEQLAAANVKVGPAADVRGLGGTFWELLTGRRLFGEAQDERDLAQMVLGSDVPRLRTIDPGLDRDLEAIVGRATERGLADRIGSAGVLAEYLNLYLDQKPLPIRPPGAAELAWRWVKAHRAVVGTAAAAALALLLGVGLLLTVFVQRQALVRSLDASLQEMAKLQQDGKWREARAVLGGLTERLTASGTADLLPRVAQARKDLEMAARLEEIATFTPGFQKSNLDWSGADADYFRAFRDYDLDVETLLLEELAQRITKSSIRKALIEALDHWADVRRRIGSNQDHLITIARLADADDLRKEIRAALLRRDRDRLEEIANQIDIGVTVPTTLWLLAQGLGEVNARQPSAEDFLRRCQSRYPAQLNINFLLAVHLRYQAGRHEEALSYFRAALAVRPESPLLHGAVGEILYLQHKFVEAEREDREIIRLKPDSPEGHYNLGVILADQNRPAEAEYPFREAIRLRPDYAEAHLGLGKALLDQHKPIEAEKAFREALHLRPGYYGAQLNLGNALAIQKRWAEAERAFREAMPLKPGDSEAHYNLGITLVEQNKLAEAEAEYREAGRLKPDDPDVHHNLANVLSRQNKLDEAEHAYREAIRLWPDNPKSHYGLGRVLLLRQKPAEAEQAFREALRRKPDYCDALVNLGIALARQNKLPEAEAAYRDAIRLKPEDPEAHFNLGVALARGQKLVEAEREYREAIRINPALPDAHHNLGVVLADQNKWAEAEVVYCEAIRLKPDHSESHYNLGVALERQNRLPAAERAYREALRLKPD